MFILRLQPFDLDPGDTHISTIWQVSENSPDFSNILIETQEDVSNLLIKIFNIEATEGRKYYARARTISENAGLSVWSNVDVEIAVDIDDSLITTQEPKRIKPPQFNLSFAQNEFNHNSFIINLTPQQLTSATGHIATTWIIRNLEGKLLFISERDEVNLYELLVETILKENEIYIFEAQYHYANNDISMVGGISVYTARSQITSYIPKSTNPDGSFSGTYVDGVEELNIELDIPTNAIGSIIEIYKDSILIHTINGTSYNEEDIEYDSNGLITVRAKSILPIPQIDEWIYRTFISMNRQTSALPAGFPTPLG